jgi:hypothetical protein
MSGFSAEWLRQREPVDLAARDRELARDFAAALKQRQTGTLRIIDLAAGSGSNFRALVPLLKGEQSWSLVDHDYALLAAQSREIASWAQAAGWRCENDGGGVTVRSAAAPWRAQPQQLDLAQALHALDFSVFDAVTTTAFLDLVSAEWIERFCDQLVRAQRPLLATLTVDGRRAWWPEHPADSDIAAVFARHQGGDKGFGRALGSSAADYLAQRLSAAGYAVSSARSDWRLGAAHGALLRRLAEESVAVARETDPSAAARHAEWLVQRTAQIEAGTLSLTVGHRDLLALPPAR